MFNPHATIVQRISPEQPEPAIIAEAAELLRRGGLVAFPTETVYGLGANALNAAAVESIFKAKGRPPHNPLIVHVADVAEARSLAAEWPEQAARLAERFWPGSLTLVLAKRPIVPELVTAGGPTVGLRVPAHPVALALLRAANMPIAAPSANCSSRISPTTAQHVLHDMEGRVDLILDAGPTPGGLESTVLDLTADPPRVLRPGLVTLAQIEAVIGSLDTSRKPLPTASNAVSRSPGLLPRHYAPRAKVVCVTAGDRAAVESLILGGKRVGWLRMVCDGGQGGGGETSIPPPHPGPLPGGEGEKLSRLVVIDMPRDIAGYAARLYAALHELDDASVDCIVVDLPPADDAWLAIHDRLRRASHSE